MVIHLLLTSLVGLPSRPTCNGLFQGLAQLGASAVTNTTNAVIANKTNKANLEAVRDTNQTNLDIQRETNAANLQIAQDANALNYQMFNEQNSWNESMWLKQNEYNDPSNQMARLIAAGINPNLIASNGDAGNSTSLPQSAQFQGAQVATMNPAHMESPRKDPYEVAFQIPDFVGAMATAAGIDKTQVETDVLRNSRDFQVQNFNDDHEFKAAQTKFLLAQFNEFVSSAGYRGSMRDSDMRLRLLTEKGQEITNKMWQEQLKQRKDNFKWAKSLRGTQKAQLEANLKKTYKEISHMSAQDLFMKAQEQHLINQDRMMGEMNEAQIKALRQNMLAVSFDNALKYYSMYPDQRKQFATYMSKNPDDIGHLLDGAIHCQRTGNYNNWISAVLHEIAYPILNGSVDLYNYLFSDDDDDVDVGGIR